MSKVNNFAIFAASKDVSLNYFTVALVDICKCCT